MSLPLVAITMGDPAGVGPETIAGAWPSAALASACRPVVIGHPEVMRRAAVFYKLRLQVVEVGSIEEAQPSTFLMPCLRAGSDAAASVSPAKIDPRGGQAA